MVEQEATSIFKERFVPPDLSIWDYFIAKVRHYVPLLLVSYASLTALLYFNHIIILYFLFVCHIHYCCCVHGAFSLRCRHQKAELNTIQRRARAVKMKKTTMMNMNMRLTPTLHKENIRTTIHTGNDSDNVIVVINIQ